MAKRKHRRKRRGSKPDELNLTPMIDVVFQLLVYFVFTFEPLDVFTHLSVFRPAPDRPPPNKETEPPEIVKIAILPNGQFTINEKSVTQEQMERMLFSLADLNANQMVLITCTNASLHQYLIELLNLCAKAKLVNLSVVSQ